MSLKSSNFAWFYSFNGTGWRMLNGLRNLYVATDPVFFEYGNTTTGLHRHQVPAGSLKHVIDVVTPWVWQATSDPTWVWGAHNLFAPLLHHWGRVAQVAARPVLCDILEMAVMPGAVPTIVDRSEMGDDFAGWLGGQNYQQPYDFFHTLLHS